MPKEMKRGENKQNSFYSSIFFSFFNFFLASYGDYVMNVSGRKTIFSETKQNIARRMKKVVSLSFSKFHLFFSFVF